MNRPGRIIAAIAVVTAAVAIAAVATRSSEPAAAGPAVTTTTNGEGPTTTSEGPTTTDPPPFDRSQLPADLEFVTRDWTTDFSRTTIDYTELLIGIRATPIRDRIPPIDDPAFVPTVDADHVDGREPGLALALGEDARFYPLSILTAHEIVNDVVDGRPVAVTYCPLCNSAIVFDRTFEGRELRFGVSGLLRNSDLVMWDNVTESLWQQLTGEGIVGKWAGAQLTFLPSTISSFADFRARHPDGQVLGPDQGFGRRYGYNPYVGYSSRSSPYGFFQQPLDERFPALERVVNVTVGDTAKAYPFSVLQTASPVNDTVAGQDIVVLWGGDTADALDDGDIAASRGVGTGVAFSREVDGELLTFSAAPGGGFVDDQTGSEWNLNGTATAGPLAGAQLDPVIHGNEFWFAWAAFNPDAPVYGP